jgi:hypothetical protein
MMTRDAVEDFRLKATHLFYLFIFYLIIFFLLLLLLLIPHFMYTCLISCMYLVYLSSYPLCFHFQYLPIKPRATVICSVSVKVPSKVSKWKLRAVGLPFAASGRTMGCRVDPGGTAPVSELQYYYYYY